MIDNRVQLCYNCLLVPLLEKALGSETSLHFSFDLLKKLLNNKI